MQPIAAAPAPMQVTFHHVNVTIKDQVAITEVDQEFYNPNNAQLEGHYIFPLPKGAEIDKFSMDMIAEKLGHKNRNVTKSQKSRCMRKLKAHLEEHQQKQA